MADAFDYDLYELLGVRRTASSDEIRRAFRSRVAELHPDKHGNDPKKTRDFKRVKAAFGILSDPTHRARYDASRNYDTSEMPEATRVRAPPSEPSSSPGSRSPSTTPPNSGPHKRRTCRNCGTSNDPGRTRCWECNESLDGEPKASSAGPRVASPPPQTKNGERRSPASPAPAPTVTPRESGSGRIGRWLLVALVLVCVRVGARSFCNTATSSSRTASVTTKTAAPRLSTAAIDPVDCWMADGTKVASCAPGDSLCTCGSTAPEPTQARTVSVTFDVFPIDAKVFIDGKEALREGAPGALFIRPSWQGEADDREHVLRVQKTGWVTTTQPLRLDRSKTVSVHLELSTGLATPSPATGPSEDDPLSF